MGKGTTRDEERESKGGEETREEERGSKETEETRKEESGSKGSEVTRDTEEKLTVDTMDLIREMEDMEDSNYDAPPARYRPITRITRSMANK